MPIIVASSTSLPDSITFLAARPSGVPSCTACRRMSPVEILGTPRVRANRSACVPFPAPGGPNITSLTDTALAASTPNTRLLHEAVVVPHDELRLDLLHRVHRHTDDDEQRRAAEIERHVHAFGDE